jgi:hypothetical protein
MGSFAVALTMSRDMSTRAMGRIDIALKTGADAHTRMGDPALERLRSGIPAARCLPLIAAIARRSADLVRLEYGTSQLEVAVEPCA